jgi:hypothetical protein
MSPRRRGRGRHGAPAAAVTPHGPPASGGQPAAVIDAAVAAADGMGAGASSHVAPKARQPAPIARATQSPRLGGPVRPSPRGSRPAEVAAPASVSGRVDGEAEIEAGTEAVVEWGERKPSCTLAQMRRFIKSRPYVPLHELRRRFVIEGIEDEVSPMPTGDGTLFVGLPPQEAIFLGELVKSGEVGCELLLDPVSPAVVGVFPMRPVARQ